VIRKAVKNHRLFPIGRFALKVVFLAIEQVAQTWTMPVKDWKLALNRCAIEFGERLLASQRIGHLYKMMDKLGPGLALDPTLSPHSTRCGAASPTGAQVVAGGCHCSPPAQWLVF